MAKYLVLYVKLDLKDVKMEQKFHAKENSDLPPIFSPLETCPVFSR